MLTAAPAPPECPARSAPTRRNSLVVEGNAGNTLRLLLSGAEAGAVAHDFFTLRTCADVLATIAVGTSVVVDNGSVIL